MRKKYNLKLVSLQKKVYYPIKKYRNNHIVLYKTETKQKLF